MSKVEARIIAVEAINLLYESRWDDEQGHIWGDMTTWEIKDEIIEALKEAFK